MRTIALGILAPVLFAVPAWASEPGQPLDCSDWVFLEPGLQCEPYPCAGVWGGDCVASHDVRAFDNTGRVLSVLEEPVPGSDCMGGMLNRLALVARNGPNVTVLATITERCIGRLRDRVTAFHGNLSLFDLGRAHVLFDPVNGSLLVTAGVFCHQIHPAVCTYSTYEGCSYCIPPLKIFRITGFATLFDVVQSYTPAPPTIGVRVPAHPEGLRAADHFDTYWGKVAELPDFARAQPMACNYPADHQPQPGEYFTVADTSPVPASSQANYVVTAVTYAAERRYGRQRIGGVMSGRNPALLPSCP